MNIFLSITATLQLLFFPQSFLPDTLSNHSLEQQPDTTIRILQSPSDTGRRYQYLRLDNGIRAVLISEPAAQMSAAAVLVEVGSNGEADKFMGLAHYLEHALFLGTKKYPESESFSKFVQERNGEYNAGTGYSSTVFFFDIQNDYISNALDQLADFFIDPLFDPNYLNKERHAVNAEFEQQSANDNVRSMQVLKSTLINPAHPYHRFHVGNLETLSFENNGTVLRQTMIDFWQKYYGPKNLILSTLSPKSILEQKGIVKQTFGKVPINNSIKKPNITKEPIFQKDNLRKWIEVKSINDIKHLFIFIDIPPFDRFYKSKPFEFLASLIYSPHIDGLSDFLIYQKKYLDNIAASYEKLSDWRGLWSIKFELTDNGLKEIDQLIAIFFDYLKKIELQGIEKWRFDELRELNKFKWKFLPSSSSLSAVQSVVGNLADNNNQDAVENVLFADFVYANFSADITRQLLELIKPENGVYLLLHRNAAVVDIEHFYKTAYSIQSIANSRVQKWKLSTFPTKLPPQNQYLLNIDHIPLSINTTISNPVRYRPILISNSSSDGGAVKVWCMNSDPFPTVKFTMTYQLQIPNSYHTALNQALITLLDYLLNDQILRRFSQAILARNVIELETSARGITIKVQTFSLQTMQNLSIELNQLLINQLQNSTTLITEPLFDQKKISYRKQLQNDIYFSNPIIQSLDVLDSILKVPNWPKSLILKSLETITLEMVKNFIKQQSNSMSFEAFVMLPNNIDCTQIQSEIKSIIDSIGISQQQQPFPIDRFYSVELPISKTPLVYTVDDTKHNDSSVVCYYQALTTSGTIDVSVIIFLILIEQIFTPLFFGQLRTFQQLGYSATLKSVDYGLEMMVESPPNTFTSTDIYHRIIDFVQSMDNELDKLSDSDFKQHKSILLEVYTQNATDSSSLYNFIYNQIKISRYQYDFQWKLVDAINQITFDQLKQFVKQLQQFSNQSQGTWIIFRTPPALQNATSADELDSFQQIKDVVAFKQNLKALRY